MLASAQESVRYDGPIIDVHLHAQTEIWSVRRPCRPAPCIDSATLAKSADELKPMTLKAMQRNNIVMGVVSEVPNKVLPWTNEDGRFLTGILINTPDQYAVAELRDSSSLVVHKSSEK